MPKRQEVGKRHSDLTQTQSSLGCYGVDILNGNDIRTSSEGLWNLLSEDYKWKSQPALMVWNANNKIVELEETKHTPAEIKTLNKKGIHIYLFEPMCSYIVDDPTATLGVFNCGFYSEFPNKLPKNRKNIRSAELDSILLYAENNKLNNITVYTGDYNVHRYYTYYKPTLSLKCDDMFFKCLTAFNILDTEPKNSIVKPFISTNWRFTPARALISSYLAKKDTDLVWYFDVDLDKILDTPWISIDSLKQDTDRYKKVLFGNARLNQDVPCYLDLYSDRATKVTECMGHYYPAGVANFKENQNPVADNPHTLGLQDYYRRCFVDVVNESRYAQPTGNLSEKVLQAVQFQTPFIMVGPPHSLKYLKTFGYKTFDKWWDESYDAEEDHEKRMYQIMDLIDSIADQPIQKLRAIYQEMLPILRHNLEVFIKSVPGGHLRDIANLRPEDLNEVQWQHSTEIRNVNEDDHTAEMTGDITQMIRGRDDWKSDELVHIMGVARAKWEQVTQDNLTGEKWEHYTDDV